MVKLNQIVAVEKSSKSRTDKSVNAGYHIIQKPEPFNGLVRVYTPKDEEGDQLPQEKQNIQANVNDVIKDVSEALTSYFDVIATKDWGNASVTADIVVDDQAIITGVPVPYLLFLEKQLTDVHTFVSKLPTLSNTEKWTWDDNTNSWRSDPVETTRSKKVYKNHVKAEPTEHHPAQVEVFTEDVIVGTWKNTKFSAALPAVRQRELLDRVEALQKAVKFAREEANSQTVEQIKVGEAIFNYIFA